MIEQVGRGCLRAAGQRISSDFLKLALGGRFAIQFQGVRRRIGERRSHAERRTMPTVLVTGAARGIGRALVELYAQRGDTVFALVRRPPADPWRTLAAAPGVR